MRTDNSILPAVEITLAGREHKLVFDFNAQAAFEKITGTSIFDPKAMRTSSRIVRALLWAELLHHDKQVKFDEFGEIVVPPELSLNQVGSLITAANLREVNKKVFEAYRLFFREEKPAEESENERGDKNPPNR